MANYGFVSPGAMAGNALEEFFVQRELAERQRLLDALKQQEQDAAIRQRDEQIGLQRQQFTADDAERKRLADRQARVDAEAATDKNLARSKEQNALGVMQMSMDAANQGVAPGIIARQALGQGVEIPLDVLDPDRELKEYEAKRKIDARYDRTGAQQQEWVIRNGQPVPIPAGTAQPGDRPYDPVAARTSQPENKAEAIDTAREVQRIASTLRNAKGFAGVFGKWSSQMPTVLASQDTVDARTLLNSLKGLLTIENMGKMKGVLSDADMRVLQQASTTLTEEMSEEAAAAELDRLVEVMGRVVDGGAQPMNTQGGAAPVQRQRWTRGPDGRPVRAQ